MGIRDFLFGDGSEGQARPEEAARSRDPMPATVPWERMPGEPDTAWSLFSAYLATPSANVAKFARGPNSDGTPTSMIQAYSARWRWHARRAAMEQHLARTRAEGAAEAAKAQGASLAHLANELREIATEAAASLRLRGEVENMTPREVLAYAEKAITLSRLLAGESTSTVALDFSTMPQDERDQLRALLAKGGAVDEPAPAQAPPAPPPEPDEDDDGSL